MTEYWLISAPGEKTCQQTWETLNNVTSKQNNLSVNFKFQIPDLKVGTLDQLVGLSDDLGKLDVYAEGITRKIASYLGDVIEDHNDKLAELLLANGVEMAQYLTKFQWESAKYPVKQSLRNLAEIISKKVNQIESELKVKSQAYNTLKNSIESIERKQTGSLVSRDLADLVKKDDFVLNSEYLTTLVVVVPKSGVSDWNSHYENLTDMVVPRSSKLITEDADYCLYTVTLFDRVKSEFSLKARERRFIVRDFTYDEEKLAEGKNERDKLLVDKKKKYGSLVRWLKVNFSEAFSAWIHVKALRLFVESVLRYGLPVNFQAMILHPPKRSMKRLAEVLNQLYSHLDSSSLPQNQSDPNNVEIPGLSFGQSEYYPYVCYKIDIDMVPHKTRIN